MHYHVGHNMPGYLPESDVYTTDDIDSAIDVLIEDLRFGSDAQDSWADEHDCDDIPCPTYGDDCPWQAARNLEAEASDLAAKRTDALDAGDFYIYAAGLAYWIRSCDDDCDTEDEI